MKAALKYLSALVVLALVVLGNSAASATGPTSEKCAFNNNNYYPLTTSYAATPGELTSLLAAASAGDEIVVRDGVYLMPGITVSNLAGTAANPIIVRAENLHGATILMDHGAGYNPGVVRMAGNSHLVFEGFVVDGAYLSGPGSPPQQPNGGPSSLVGMRIGSGNNPNTDVTVKNNKVMNVGQAGIKIDSSRISSSQLNNNKNISVLCNQISNTGLVGGALKHLGEGIYVGNGQLLDSHDENIVISNNEIFNTLGEAIDIKSPVKNVTITGNVLHDSELQWAGMITLGMNKTSYDNGTYKVHGNLIYNITSRPGHGSAGHGIVVGQGSTEIYNNIISNVDGRALTYYQRAGGTNSVGFGTQGNTTVKVYNNTFQGCALECVREHTYLFDTNATITPDFQLFNNLSDATLPADYLLAPAHAANNRVYSSAATEFVGPVSGDANLGQGFAPAATSGAIDSGVDLSSAVTDDFFGAARPAGAAFDFGAVEATSASTTFAIGNTTIWGQDSATGDGFILFSEEGVKARLGVPAGAADHLVAVRYNDGLGAWEYFDNETVRPLVPRGSDRLIASVDFAADTRVMLGGQLTSTHGIVTGYVSSDVDIIPNYWNGNFNGGEFDVTGSYLEVATPTTFAMGNTTIWGQDSASGDGFILFSEEGVKARFGVVAGSADHLVAVRFNDGLGAWEYFDNETIRPLVPWTTDRLIAAVDFGADTRVMLAGQMTTTHGIATGYVSSDVDIIPNYWNGNFNGGEFDVTGTYLDVFQ